MSDTPATTDLGVVDMVPVGTPTVETPAPELSVAPAPAKRRAGRPTNAEKAAELARKQAEKAAAEQQNETPGEGQIVHAPQSATPPATGEDHVGDSVVLGFYPMNASAKLPTPATAFSAGADVRANFDGVSEVESFTSANRPGQIGVRENYGVRSIVLQPGGRAKIPTGLILDIPAGFRVAVYPRSGLSLKSGMNLANCVAVIDYDYTDQLYILVANTSQLRAEIVHDDRIAQLALEKVWAFEPVRLSAPPDAKSDRTGGIGSTGVQ